MVLRLAIADFRERTRRYSFFIAITACVVICYSIGSGEFTFHWGAYIGSANGAWIGMNFAVISVLFFSLAGFYLCKGSIAFDEKSGVGFLIGSTQTSDSGYISSKILSNIFFLCPLFLIFLTASMLSLQVAGNVSQRELSNLICPQLIVALPILFSVAAIAVLFDSLRLLQRGLGNILYFFVWITLVNYSNSAQTIHDLDLLGFTIFKYDFRQTLVSTIGTAEGFWDLSLRKENFSTVDWQGTQWNMKIIWIRMFYILPFIAFGFLSTTIFKRFDDTESRLIPKKRLNGLHSFLLSSATAFDNQIRDRFARFDSSRLFIRRIIFADMQIIAEHLLELKLMLKNQNMLWYLLIVWLHVWCLFTASHFDVRYVALPWLIIAPILVWSRMGTYESYYKVASLIYTTQRSIRKQLTLRYTSGVLIGLVITTPILLKALILGDLNLAAITLIFIAFLPALALALGIISRGSKLFEVTFVLAWYIGPLRGHPIYDQLFNLPYPQLGQFLALMSMLTLAFLILSVLSRTVQLHLK